MDANGKVVIESRRQLTPGLYIGLRVRACTTDPVAVQIWRMIDNNTFQFQWQTVIRPVLSQTTRTYFIVNFDSPLTITSDDRLGLYALANSSNLAIPFGSDPDLFYLYYSMTLFNDFTSVDNTSLQINLDDLRWPRSFNGSVRFCQAADCTDLSPDVPVGPPSSTLQPPVSVPPGQCCPAPLQCDSSQIVNPITNQTNELAKLNAEANNFTVLFNQLVNSLNRTNATGTCRQGFVAGTVPDGQCYLVISNLVPLGVAALTCEVQYNSILLQIKSNLEDIAIRTLIASSGFTFPQTFWTAGVFNTADGNWYWYDDSSRTKTPFVYTNWGPTSIATPIPTTDSDVCVKLVVVDPSTSYWAIDNCSNNYNYVCQVPKTCF